MKMEINVDDITAWVGDFFWPFIRLGALFAAAPIFGARTVPIRARIILAVAVTVLIQPSLPLLPAIDPLSPRGLLIIFQQVVIGLSLAMIMQLIFSTLVMTGQMVATTMGLGFASTVDPQNGVQVTMLGQFYLIIATLFFLAFDGHLVLIRILADSFTTLPIDGEFIDVQVFWGVANYTSEVLVSAVLVALPIMLGVLLVNLAFGVMTRAAPQLNIFAVGFSLTILAGFVLMAISIPLLSPLLSNLFANGFGFMRAVVN
jgi:flagellar biosynthetic protein FliR